MKNDQKKISIISGLSILGTQWKLLIFAILASIVILSLDFFLTISIPKIIDSLMVILDDTSLHQIPTSILVMICLIIFRPLVGWLINLFQISIILTILRRLENQILSESKRQFTDKNFDYSSENSANILISHGRWYVDAFLIPFIRGLTDLGSILVISFGLFMQFPMPLTFFLISAFISLGSYQYFSKNLLSRNGEIIIYCYEDIIKSSNNGFIGSIQNPKTSSTESELDKVTINEVLDHKQRAGVIVGSIAQGIKYVVEFCFMFSFGIATIAMVLLTDNIFAAFVSTFAYAGIRMLPAFTSVISFFQSMSTAEHAVTELSDHLRKF